MKELQKAIRKAARKVEIVRLQRRDLMKRLRRADADLRAAVQSFRGLTETAVYPMRAPVADAAPETVV